MPDSGNSFGSCISLDMFRQLGYKDSDLETLSNEVSVSTAKKGAKLMVKGRLRNPLKIQLGDCPETFSVRPYVIPGLSMDLNLSKSFMARNQIDEIHSTNTLRIKNMHIPLGKLEESSPIAIAYLKDEITVPAGETGRVPLSVPDWGKLGTHQVTHFEPDPTLFFKTGCLPERSMRKTADESGKLFGQVMNITSEPVTFPKGLRYGELVRIESQILAAISPVESVPEPSMRERIRKGFKLDDPTCVLTSQKDRKRAEDLLYDFRDLFAWDSLPGKTNLIEHRIPLKEGTPPIHCKTRPMNPQMEEVFKEQLLTWLRTGVIKETKSPYNAGVVIGIIQNNLISYVHALISIVNSCEKDASR